MKLRLILFHQICEQKQWLFEMNIGKHKSRLSEWFMLGWQLSNKKKPRLQVQEEVDMRVEVAIQGYSHS